MIATLPMYDMLPQQMANDRLWSAIREALGYGPLRLDRYIGLWEGWQSHQLVLSQTCSMPYRMGLHGHVNIVAAPDFGVPGCAPGQYNSVLVAREDDDRDLRTLLRAHVAINQKFSQSGFVTIWDAAQAHGARPERVTETGGHVHSVRAVADGEADIAAIDAHTWRILCLHDANTKRLREIERTPPTPAMPFITSRQNDPAEIFAALKTALTTLDGATKMRLGLRDVVPIDAMEIMAMETPPAPTTQR